MAVSFSHSPMTGAPNISSTISPSLPPYGAGREEPFYDMSVQRLHDAKVALDSKRKKG
jgi:hypothetical protein